MKRRLFAALLLGRLLWAHSARPVEPGDLWQAWSFQPGILLPLVVTALLYARGACTERGVSKSQVAFFWTGWTLLAIDLVSPLHALGEALFAAHMIQHEIFMVASAPLLVLSRPLVPLLWGMPIEWRKALGGWSKRESVQDIWRFVMRPMTAWWIHAAALWIWHIPVLFQSTLYNEWVHAAQHLSFFGSALLFWWALFYARGRASYGAGVLYLFTTAVHTSVLGALLTFGRTVWYPAYVLTAGAWGVRPLEDQQIGGLIMWVPAGLVYLAAGLWMFGMWLRESDVAAMSREYAR